MEETQPPPPATTAPSTDSPLPPPPTETAPATSSTETQPPSASTSSANPSLNPTNTTPSTIRPQIGGNRPQSLPPFPFGSSRPFNQTYNSLANTPVRSITGFQKMGAPNSLTAGSQLRPSGIPGHHQHPLSQPSLRAASPAINQTSSSQKMYGHPLSRVPSLSSPGAPSTVPSTRPQALQQSLLSSQGKQSVSSLPSSYRPQMRPQAMQRGAHLLQPHQQSLPVSTHQQQISSSQQQKQQQLHQRLQQQHTSSQQLPEHHHFQPLRNQLSMPPQQQGAQTQGLAVQKPTIPVSVQPGTVNPTVTTDAESGNRIVSKRSIRELVSQIDPSEKLDPEVEDVLAEIGDDFIESITSFACSLAKHRKSNTLEAKDILLHVERNWNMMLPGFGGDEIKCYKKPLTNDIHKERLAMIKKSMTGTNEAGNAKNPSVGQATANHKTHASKAPAPGSPK